MKNPKNSFENLSFFRRKVFLFPCYSMVIEKNNCGFAKQQERKIVLPFNPMDDGTCRPIKRLQSIMGLDYPEHDVRYTVNIGKSMYDGGIVIGTVRGGRN